MRSVADEYLVSRKNPEEFRKDLLAMARTTLSSKVLAADKDYFAELAVSAVLRLKVSCV
jgi:T-complex protein 1 subunit beta